MATRFTLGRQELAAKVEWEGGIIPAWEYGLRSEHIEDATVAALWRRLEQGDESRERLISELESIIDMSAT